MLFIQAEHAPDIIREAASSTLGILALMVLAMAVLALIFFRGAGEKVRVSMFVMMLLSVAGFAYAIVDEAGGGSAGRSAARDELVAGDEPSGEQPEPRPARRRAGRPAQTVEAQDFVFALDGCRRSGRETACSFLITNRTADRELYFNLGGSRFVDPAGNEYGGESGTLGRESGTGTLYNNLISDVPLRAGINFPGVPDEVERMAVLELRFGNFNVQFRDVPIGR